MQKKNLMPKFWINIKEFFIKLFSRRNTVNVVKEDKEEGVYLYDKKPIYEIPTTTNNANQYINEAQANKSKSQYKKEHSPPPQYSPPPPPQSIKHLQTGKSQNIREITFYTEEETYIDMNSSKAIYQNTKKIKQQQMANVKAQTTSKRIPPELVQSPTELMHNIMNSSKVKYESIYHCTNHPTTSLTTGNLNLDFQHNLELKVKYVNIDEYNQGNRTSVYTLSEITDSTTTQPSKHKEDYVYKTPIAWGMLIQEQLNNKNPIYDIPKTTHNTSKNTEDKSPKHHSSNNNSKPIYYDIPPRLYPFSLYSYTKNRFDKNKPISIYDIPQNKGDIISDTHESKEINIPFKIKKFQDKGQNKNQEIKKRNIDEFKENLNQPLLKQQKNLQNTSSKKQTKLAEKDYHKKEKDIYNSNLQTRTTIKAKQKYTNSDWGIER